MKPLDKSIDTLQRNMSAAQIFTLSCFLAWKCVYVPSFPYTT